MHDKPNRVTWCLMHPFAEEVKSIFFFRSSHKTVSTLKGDAVVCLPRGKHTGVCRVCILKVCGTMNSFLTLRKILFRYTEYKSSHLRTAESNSIFGSAEFALSGKKSLLICNPNTIFHMKRNSLMHWLNETIKIQIKKDQFLNLHYLMPNASPYRFQISTFPNLSNIVSA